MSQANLTKEQMRLRMRKLATGVLRDEIMQLTPDSFKIDCAVVIAKMIDDKEPIIYNSFDGVSFYESCDCKIRIEEGNPDKFLCSNKSKAIPNSFLGRLAIDNPEAARGLLNKLIKSDESNKFSVLREICISSSLTEGLTTWV